MERRRWISIQRVIAGDRPSIPAGAFHEMEDVRNLVVTCLSSQTDERPTFDDAKAHFISTS